MSGERELSMPSVELSDASMVKIEGGEVVTWAECKRRLAFRPAHREAQPENDGDGEVNAVRLALEDAEALDRTAEDADGNNWQDWGATMRQAAIRIRALAALASKGV